MKDYSSAINEVLSSPSKTESPASKVDYSSVINEINQDKVSKLSTNLYSAMSISPEAATKQWQLSQQTKIPVEVLKTHENDVRQMTEFDAFNPQEIQDNFPKVAIQLADSNKTSAIRDDIDSLSYFERIVGNAKQSFQLNRAEVDNLKAKEKAMLFDVTGDKKYELTPLEKNNLGLLEQQKAAQKDYKLGLFTHPAVEFAARLPEYTIGQIPNLIDAGISTIGGAAAGFAVGGPAGAGVGAATGTALHTARLETASAYDEFKNLKDESGNPIEKKVAAGAAIAAGTVNGLLELVPFEAAKAPFVQAFSRNSVKALVKSNVGKQALSNIGKLALAEGVTEATQEYSNIVFAEIAKASSDKDFKPFGVDKDKITPQAVLDFLGSDEVVNRALESGKAGFGGGLGFGAASSGITYAKQAYNQRKDNVQDQSTIGEIVDKIKESKIFKRNKDLFNDATDNTLGEKSIYIPAEAVQTYFQTQKPEELEKFYQAVPEAREQIAQALETGGNLVLPSNKALGAIAANPSFVGLQEHFSFSPINLTEKQAQDSFLNEAVPNAEFTDKNKVDNFESSAVKENIKKQILGLNKPAAEAQDVIAALTSYYDTKKARYGSAEATKTLDNYLKSFEAQNGSSQKSQRVVKNIDQLDAFIDKARTNFQTKKGKPLLKLLKEKGGVKLGSNLAGELNALGITTKNAPALFRKETGLGDVDNFVTSEFQEKFPNLTVKAKGDYVDRQAVLDLIAREVGGEDLSKIGNEEQESLRNFVDGLDRLGVDVKTASNQEIKQAIKDYEKGEKYFQFGGKKYYQNEKNPLGQTQFIGQKPIITLFKNANRSTLLHELGHVFLQIESNISKLLDVSEQTKKDWQAIEEWLEIKDGKITTEAHEKFARGFESYLREGRAPSISLRNAFRRFRSWLIRVYKNAQALDVKINDKVRGVFDRMLATDEEIENLRNNPIYRADTKVLDSLDAKEKEQYLKLSQNSTEKAKEKLLSEALKQEAFKKTKTYKEEKANVRKQVEEQLRNTPTFQALDFLRDGKIPNEDAITDEPHKLSRSDVENYEGDFFDKLPKSIISEDGLPVDVVAENLGFKDGGEMLNELANAPNFNREVIRLTNEEMDRRTEDMMTNEEVMQDDAINASENEAQASKILFELNAANSHVQSFVDSKEAYKQRAKDILANKEIKEATQSNIYYIDEIKVAREAGIAFGAKDYKKAVEWKKKQLLNHYLFQESQKIKKEFTAALRRYEKYKKKPVVGKVTIEEDYREKIVSLLQDFGVAAKGIDYQKTNIAELENWKKEQTDEGVLGLVAFPEITTFQNKDNIRTLTTDQFRTLNNAISNLAHIGQGLRTLDIEGKKVALDELSQEIKESIEANLKKREEIRGNLTPKQKLNAAFESFMNPLYKAPDTAIMLDGEKYLGTFYNHFIKPVSAGEINRNKMMSETYEKLDAIYKKHFGTKAGKIDGKKVFIPEANFSYSKQDMIAFALNWGNATNRNRIKDGYNYGNAQINVILSKLTKNEWEFVQSMWDLMGSHYEGVAALQKKLVGFKPNKVRPIAFDVNTADGHSIKIKGGYYPIVFDSKLTRSTNTEDLNAIFGSVNSNIKFEKSYTKGRTEGKVSKKVDLSLKPAFHHLSQVLSDLSLKEQVWNSYKILNNRNVKEAINSRAGHETTKQLDLWLKDIFGSGLMGMDAFSSAISSLRAGATISTMGLKLSTTLMQASGFSHSIVKIGFKNMLTGLFKTLGNGNPAQINNAVHLALEKSKVLKDRSKTFNRDIYDTLRKMERKGIIAEKATAIYFWPISKMQMMVDIPTWYGAYAKGMKQFNNDESKAVELADLIIAQSQGSGLESHLSAFERGSVAGARKSALVKIFTAFYSYFNAKLNLARESYRKTDFSKPSDVARFAGDFALLFWIETLVGNLLTNKVPDFGDDDDDDFLTYNLKLLIQTYFSQFPIAREVVAAAQGFEATPAGFSGIGTITKGLSSAIIEGNKDEVDISKVIEGLNQASGVIFKYPSAQIDVFIDAQQKSSQGEDVSSIDYVLRSKKN